MTRRIVYTTGLLAFLLYALVWYTTANRMCAELTKKIEHWRSIAGIEHLDYQSIEPVGFPFSWGVSIEKPVITFDVARFTQHLAEKNSIWAGFLWELEQPTYGDRPVQRTVSMEGNLILTGNPLLHRFSALISEDLWIETTVGQQALDTLLVSAAPLEIGLTLRHPSFSLRKWRDSVLFKFFSDFSKLRFALESLQINIQDFTVKKNGSDQILYQSKQERHRISRKNNEPHRFVVDSKSDRLEVQPAILDWELKKLQAQWMGAYRGSFNRAHYADILKSPMDVALKMEVQVSDQPWKYGIFPQQIECDIQEFIFRNRMYDYKGQGKLEWHPKEKKEDYQVHLEWHDHLDYRSEAAPLFHQMAKDFLQGETYFHGYQILSAIHSLIPDDFFKHPVGSDVELEILFQPVKMVLQADLKRWDLKLDDCTLGFRGHSKLSGNWLQFDFSVGLDPFLKTMERGYGWAMQLNQHFQTMDYHDPRIFYFPHFEFEPTFYPALTDMLRAISDRGVVDDKMELTLKGMGNIATGRYKVQQLGSQSIPELRLHLQKLAGFIKPQNGLAHLKVLAAEGHAGAQYNLGYYHWLHMEHQKAVEWWEKAAMQDHVFAQYQLGLALIRQQDQELDYGKAAHWLQQAAAKGNPFAQNDLAVLYERGLGVATDLDKAKEMYHQAALQHLRAAQFNLVRVNEPLNEKAFILGGFPLTESVICHHYTEKSIDHMIGAMKLLNWPSAVLIEDGPDAIPQALRPYAQKKLAQAGIKVVKEDS